MLKMYMKTNIHFNILFHNTYVLLDTVNYSEIINEKCGILQELPISTSELHIETSNTSPSSLKVKKGN